MKKENLVEETILQLQNLEDVINENAKEILASTMEKEISELVKESMKEEADDETLEQSNGTPEEMSEQESEEEEDEESEEDSEEELEMDFDDMDDDSEELDMDMMNMDMEDDSEESEMDMDMDMGGEETIDLTDASDDEILKVFKSMTDNDSISIEKDGDFLHLTDEDDEYLIQTESEEMEESWSEEMDEQEEDMDMMDMDDEMDITVADDDSEEIVYEIEMDEEEEEEEEEVEDEEEFMNENKHFAFAKGFKTETKESAKSIKPKVGNKVTTGKPNKFSYKKTDKGFKEEMPEGTKGVGMGKAKFEYKESKMKQPKKVETKEAARTLGNGKRWGRNGLDKPRSAPRHLATESMQSELEMLRTKNEEYRKSLNLFREKLNEVATFNSNLAYATRLFTEHSTSKQEKINILRRFDTAETLKESKALYKQIKDELTGEKKKFVNESIEKVIEKTPQSGSAMNLIESKTYENPQFLRMKDIMSKITK
jgi:hypothetical protein